MFWKLHSVGPPVSLDMQTETTQNKHIQYDSFISTLLLLSVRETLHWQAHEHGCCQLHASPFPQRSERVQLIDGLDFENCANAAQHRWLWSIHTTDRSAFLPAALAFPTSYQTNTIYFCSSWLVVWSSQGLSSLLVVVIEQTHNEPETLQWQRTEITHFNFATLFESSMR